MRNEYIADAMVRSKVAIYEWNMTKGNVTWSDDVNGIVKDITKDRRAKMPQTSKEFSKILSDGESKLDSKTLCHKVVSLKTSDETLVQLKNNGAVIVDKTTGDKKMIGSIELMSDNLKPAKYEYDFAYKIAPLIDSKKEFYLFNIAITNLAVISNWSGVVTANRTISELVYDINNLFGGECIVNRMSFENIAVATLGASESDTESIITRLNDILNNYYNEDGDITLRHVIGSTFYNANSQKNAEQIITESYLAVQNAREDNSNGQHISYNDGKEASESNIINFNILHDAYKAKNIRLAYQPIISAVDGSLYGYEALMRLKDGDDYISAGPYINSAEKFARINIIDEHIMRLVLEDLRKNPNIRLAFNISNRSAGNDNWLQKAQEILSEYEDVTPRLTIEITETYLRKDLRNTAYFVAVMQSLGCKVALDDFGAGYTSFKQLKNISFDMVKIDGAYIKNITKSSENLLFVEKLVDFCKSYGITTVAEFIEDGEIAKQVMALGVDYMQGYYFGKPEVNKAEKL